MERSEILATMVSYGRIWVTRAIRRRVAGLPGRRRRR